MLQRAFASRKPPRGDTLLRLPREMIVVEGVEGLRIPAAVIAVGSVANVLLWLRLAG
jgi:hypothetical protein